MNLPVARILADPRLNGVYRLEAPSALLPTLDGRVASGKEAFLEALGRALECPDYYGDNWDALEECLNDMSWREGAIALQIEHANALGPEMLSTLMDIFTEAAQSWGTEGRCCSLFLSGLGAGAELPPAE